MTRIKSSKSFSFVGRPGFKKLINAGGSRVSKDRAPRFGVRRLMKRNPADARLNPSNDAILGFTNDPDVPNVNAAPSPTKIRSANFTKKNAEVPGVSHVRNRGTNRSVRRTNS